MLDQAETRAASVFTFSFHFRKSSAISVRRNYTILELEIPLMDIKTYYQDLLVNCKEAFCAFLSKENIENVHHIWGVITCMLQMWWIGTPGHSVKHVCFFASIL